VTRAIADGMFWNLPGGTNGCHREALGPGP